MHTAAKPLGTLLDKYEPLQQGCNILKLLLWASPQPAVPQIASLPRPAGLFFNWPTDFHLAGEQSFFGVFYYFKIQETEPGVSGLLGKHSSHPATDQSLKLCFLTAFHTKPWLAFYGHGLRPEAARVGPARL